MIKMAAVVLVLALVLVHGDDDRDDLLEDKWTRGAGGRMYSIQTSATGASDECRASAAAK